MSETTAAISRIESEFIRREPSTSEILADLFEDLDREPEFILRGYSELDDLYSYERGDLVYVCARPSIGKTAYALNVAYNMVRSGLKVGFLSFEMSTKALTKRLVARESELSLGDIRFPSLLRDEKVSAYTSALSELSRYEDRLVLGTGAGWTWVEMKSWVELKKAEYNLDVVFIDYVQMIKAVGEKSEYEKITEVSSVLKPLAATENIVLIALCQLNRAVDQAGNERAVRMSDLRGSGQLEQDADVIETLHNPDKVARRIAKEKGDAVTMGVFDDLEVEILKARNGPLGISTLRFNQKTQTIEDSGPIGVRQSTSTDLKPIPTNLDQLPPQSEN